MKISEFLNEVRAEQLREGRNGVRLIGSTAPGMGLLVPWPPISEEEWEAKTTDYLQIIPGWSTT